MCSVGGKFRSTHWKRLVLFTRIQSAGITAIDGLGPLGDNDHSPEEYIVTKTLFSRIELMSNLLPGVMETEPAQ